MAKQIIYGEEARKKIQAGLDQLANTVKVLLGPDGKPVAKDLHGDAIEAAVKEALKL